MPLRCIAKAAKSIQDTPKATQVAKMLRSKEVGLLPQFSSIESVIQGAGKLHRGKNGVRIGSITGNAENIFRYLAHQYNAKIQTGQTGQKYFEFGHTRIDLTGSSNGLPTLRINQNDKLFKIRVIQ